MKTLSGNELFKLFSRKKKQEQIEAAAEKPKEPVVKIRELQKSDRGKVLDLMKEFPEVFPPQYLNGGGFGGMNSFLNFARSGNIKDIGSFVIEVDGSIAGHIAYCKDVKQFENGIYELKAVVVGGSFHKKGYGDKLVRYALTKLKETGAKCVYLITKKQGLLYFTRFGFDITGMHEYSETKKYILSKSL